jgi:ABC-type nitrate/sulfonate/bicarbonate transport system permease component
MVGATVGMGYVVLEAQQTFRAERAFAGIFVLFKRERHGWWLRLL